MEIEIAAVVLYLKKLNLSDLERFFI